MEPIIKQLKKEYNVLLRKGVPERIAKQRVAAAHKDVDYNIVSMALGVSSNLFPGE